MKSYKNLYPKLCSYKNLEQAFRKARKGKSSMYYVRRFEEDKTENLLKLKKELIDLTYRPSSLKRFVVRDPKTRVIRKSVFIDRIVHHAIVNILEPIYEKIFIYDNYANRKNKGTIYALIRFDKFKRKVSKNGRLIKYAKNNNLIKGYVLKADIKSFFDSIDHKTLMDFLKFKIRDQKLLWLINLILKNFHDKEKGMPLGNMTSQFFANVYLNYLDYFVKHKLKMKYYLRYVDDFVIIHKNKEILNVCKDKIIKYLKNLKLTLHQDKSKIYSLYKGVNLLGYRVFYHHRLLRKRNINQFKKRLSRFRKYYKNNLISYEQIMTSIEGWLAYARWGNTYKLRKDILRRINNLSTLQQ